MRNWKNRIFLPPRIGADPPVHPPPSGSGRLYVFSVALCDNDVDRDFEQFTLEALEKLKDLFLGKTGVLDHMASAEYQTARLFDTWLETDPSGRLRRASRIPGW